VRFSASQTVAYAGGAVSILNSKGATVASFEVSGDYTAANFHLGAHSSGNLLVSFVEASAPAALGETAGGSPAALLTQFMAAFDSSSAPVPSADAPFGSFDLGHGQGGGGAGFTPGSPVDPWGKHLP